MSEAIAHSVLGRTWREGDTARTTVDAFTFSIVLLAYVTGSIVAHQLLAVSGVAVYFAPAGVSAAAMLLSPTRRWPFILGAIVIGEIVVDYQLDSRAYWITGGLATARALEALVGAYILRRARERVELSSVRDVAWFFVGPATVGPLLGATVGSVIEWLAGAGDPGNMVLHWWLGDALAVVVIGGTILAMASPEERQVSYLEFTVAVSSAGVVAFVVQRLIESPVTFIALIPLMVISARLGTRAAATATLMITAIAIAAWHLGSGNTSAGSDSASLVVLNLQLLSMAAAALLVAAESSELELASQQAGYRLETVELLRRALAPEREIHHEHVHAEGVSRSASARLEVGGDWYDVAEGDDGVVAIVIGDVVGHGEEALVLMGKLRFAAQALAMLGRDSGRVLDWLAEYARQLDSHAYATCFVAYFDPVAGTLSYSSAGHPPGLLGLSDGSWRWLSEARSAPIGVPTVAERDSATVRIDDACTLVIYTDGVVERAGEVIDTGLARMFDAVVGSPDGSVSQLLDHVYSAGADDASFVRLQLRR